MEGSESTFSVGEYAGLANDETFSHVERVEVDEHGNVTDVVAGIYYGDALPVCEGVLEGFQGSDIEGRENRVSGAGSGVSAGVHRNAGVSSMGVNEKISEVRSPATVAGVSSREVNENISEVQIPAEVSDDSANPCELEDDIVVLEGVGDDGDLVLRVLEEFEEEMNEGDDHCPVAESFKGMLFNSGVEFVSHMHRYGHSAGFGVTIRDSVKDPSKKIPRANKQDLTKWFDLEAKYHHYTKIRIWCRKGGKFTSRSKDPNRTTTSCKTECPYIVNARRSPINGTVWKVTKVHGLHNHDLHPELMCHLPRYRTIKMEDQRIAMQLHAGGVGVANIYDIFVNRYKKIEKVPFTQSDLRNFIYFVDRKPLKDTDFARMEVHFKKMRAQTPNFFYEYDTEGGRLKSVFWADSRCREAFLEFGEVVSFDTTFVSNRYKMPFAPFIGVNNHGKSMLFGCALLGKEDIPSFCWLFKTWLKCMGKQPACILTDQDKAMGRAIAMEFPGTSHRWCIWHVMRNCRKHLGMLPRWGEMAGRLQNLLHDSFSIEEFEAKWTAWVGDYGLGSNKWVTDMYKDRSRWVPVFFKSTFWAGMSSTQRSEGMHHYLKGFVDINTCLTEFVQQYGKAVCQKIAQEVKDNAAGIDRYSRTTSRHPFEPIFEKLFTRTMFVKFHEQLVEKDSNSGTISKVISDSVVEYLVVVKKFREGWTRRRNFRVIVDRITMDVMCDCRLFEFSGIMCSHMLRVFWEEDTLEVPDKYVCKHWRKDIGRKYLTEPYPMDALTAPIPIESRRYEATHKVAKEISFLVMNSAQLHKETLAKLVALRDELNEKTINPEGIVSTVVGGVGKVYRNIGKASAAVNVERDTTFNDEGKESGVKDPIDKRGRGKGPTKRKIPFHEQVGSGRGRGRKRGRGGQPSTPTKDVPSTFSRGWQGPSPNNTFKHSLNVTGGTQKIPLRGGSFAWF